MNNTFRILFYLFFAMIPIGTTSAKTTAEFCKLYLEEANKIQQERATNPKTGNAKDQELKICGQILTACKAEPQSSANKSRSPAKPSNRDLCSIMTNLQSFICTGNNPAKNQCRKSGELYAAEARYQKICSLEGSRFSLRKMSPTEKKGTQDFDWSATDKRKTKSSSANFELGSGGNEKEQMPIIKDSYLSITDNKDHLYATISNTDSWMRRQLSCHHKVKSEQTDLGDKKLCIEKIIDHQGNAFGEIRSSQENKSQTCVALGKETSILGFNKQCNPTYLLCRALSQSQCTGPITDFSMAIQNGDINRIPTNSPLLGKINSGEKQKNHHNYESAIDESRDVLGNRKRAEYKLEPELLTIHLQHLNELHAQKCKDAFDPLDSDNNKAVSRSRSRQPRQAESLR